MAKVPVAIVELLLQKMASICVLDVSVTLLGTLCGSIKLMSRHVSVMSCFCLVSVNVARRKVNACGWIAWQLIDQLEGRY